MTDSKTPDWAREEADRIASVEWLTPAERLNLWETISQALLSAYERGRKEGIEGVAAVERLLKRAEEHAGTLPAKEAVKLRPSDWHALSTAIRQLLEGK